MPTSVCSGETHLYLLFVSVFGVKIGLAWSLMRKMYELILPIYLILLELYYVENKSK